MKTLARSLLASALMLGAALSPAAAEGTLRISEQFGTLYIPFHVLKERKLIEKYAKEEGIEVDVEWRKLSGGSAVNDALLSGSIDIASAGIGPFLTVWDRTKGSVKIIGAFGAQPSYLLTNNPAIKSLKDFGPNDRIATPAAIVSVQGRTLQIASEKEFGEGGHNKLDANQVSLPHPDATAALLSGSTEITAHLSNQPYQEQALKNPKVHKILSSYEALGGPITPTLAYSTIKFREENPKTYRAFFRAFQEATEWAGANRKEAAEIYVRAEKSKLEPGFVQEVIENPDVRFTLVPLNTHKFADFMFKTGAIKTKPGSWKDYTFADLHEQAGS
jgi:NitT/TauT family transport system substrate-binding protein